MAAFARLRSTVATPSRLPSTFTTGYAASERSMSRGCVVPSRTSAETSSGCRSANSAASAPPSEWPAITQRRPGSSAAMKRRARSSAWARDERVGAWRPRNGRRMMVAGYPASATARASGAYAFGCTIPPGKKMSPLEAAPAVGRKVIRSSSCATRTFGPLSSVPSGSPCAWKESASRSTDRLPRLAHTIRILRCSVRRSTSAPRGRARVAWRPHLAATTDRIESGRYAPPAAGTRCHQ